MGINFIKFQKIFVSFSFASWSCFRGICHSTPELPLLGALLHCYVRGGWGCLGNQATNWSEIKIITMSERERRAHCNAVIFCFSITCMSTQRHFPPFASTSTKRRASVRDQVLIIRHNSKRSIAEQTTLVIPQPQELVTGRRWASEELSNLLALFMKLLAPSCRPDRCSEAHALPPKSNKPSIKTIDVARNGLALM